MSKFTKKCMAIDPDAVRTQRPDGMAMHFFVNLALFKSLYLSQKARSARKTVDVNSEWRYHLLGLVQWLVLQHVLQKVIWIEGLITCMSYWVENKSLKRCDFSLKSPWKVLEKKGLKVCMNHGLTKCILAFSPAPSAVAEVQWSHGYSALDSRSSGSGSSPARWHCVVFFFKTLYSHSVQV